MNTASLLRWLVGASLAGASLGLHAERAMADIRLLVAGTNSNSSCQPNSTSDYYMEAWGYFGAIKGCEAFTRGGSAMATCGGLTNSYSAVITTRAKSNASPPLSIISTAAGPTSPATAWNTFSSPSALTPTLSLSVANSATCPGGANISATAVGYNVNDAP